MSERLGMLHAMDQRGKLWQEVRALRASPPALAAADKERSAVFVASLRQAQELAEAAAASGYATRPLPLFYSFSQGLRAVSAALVDDSAWIIRGHGASVVPAWPVLQTSVVPRPSNRADSRDTLSAIHAVADGESMTAPMRLGAVWAACPESPSLSHDVEDAPGPLRLHLPPAMRREDHISAGRIELGAEGLSVDLSDQELQARLTSYPSLSGAKPAREVIPEGDTPAYRTDLPQVVFAHTSRLGLKGLFPWLDSSPVLAWETHGNDRDSYQARFETLGPVEIEGVDDVRLAFPSLGGVDKPEFVALWWVLLLALSSLVRYEPAHWARAIDPDSSKLAVPLEQTCDFTETFVPSILLHMISSAS